MSETTLYRQQMEMVRYLRDPAAEAPPAGVEPRRLQIYENLIYNNIEGFIGSGFPVLKSLYSEQDWHELVRAFIRSHRCESPYFLELAQEFLGWLLDSGGRRDCDPGFIVELAHYEWIELALDIDEYEPSDCAAPVDPLEGCPTLSPLAKVLAYNYPVHLIGPDNRDPGRQPTWLLVYRDSEQRVRYVELNAATARLLELIRENRSASGRVLLQELAAEMGRTEEEITGFARPLLDEWREQRIVLCTTEHDPRFL